MVVSSPVVPMSTWCAPTMAATWSGASRPFWNVTRLELGPSRRAAACAAGARSYVLTANSTRSSVIDTTNTGTANYTGGITGNGGFGRPYNATSNSLMTFSTVENNTNITPGGFTSLKLEEFIPTGSGTANAPILGTFELFSNGTFEFLPAAVPEPSTWAAGALSAAGMIGFMVRRRIRTVKG